MKVGFFKKRFKFKNKRKIYYARYHNHSNLFTQYVSHGNPLYICSTFIFAAIGANHEVNINSDCDNVPSVWTRP